MGGLLAAIGSGFAPAAGGGGTPAFSEFVNSATSDQDTKTATLTVASGNLLVAIIVWADASTTCTVDDNNTNSWVQVGSTINKDTNLFMQMWYAKNTHAGSTTVSAHLGVSHFSTLAVWEASGCSTTAPLDGSGTTVIVPPTSTVATSQNVEFLVSGWANFEGLSGTAQASWAEDYDSGDFSEFQHFVTSSTGTYSGNITWSGSATMVGFFGAFK